jgi:hypothetical protein
MPVLFVRHVVALCRLSSYTGLTPNGETGGVLTTLRSSFQFLASEPSKSQSGSSLPYRQYDTRILLADSQLLYGLVFVHANQDRIT